MIVYGLVRYSEVLAGHVLFSENVALPARKFALSRAKRNEIKTSNFSGTLGRGTIVTIRTVDALVVSVPRFTTIPLKQQK